MLVAPYVRTVKAASGGAAVQAVRDALIGDGPSALPSRLGVVQTHVQIALHGPPSAAGRPPAP